MNLKGVDQLITAFSRICSNYHTVLDIVGDGVERSYLEEMVCKSNISNKVNFHGYQKDATPYFEKADIFVYPSKTEIFGISIVEAMAFKCICIANNVGGIPEIIINKENGFLNMSNTVEELIKKMKEAIFICNDATLKYEMMAKAYITAKKFSINRTIDSLERLFESVAGD